jgi:hypothetical protein
MLKVQELHEVFKRDIVRLEGCTIAVSAEANVLLDVLMKFRSPAVETLGPLSDLLPEIVG